MTAIAILMNGCMRVTYAPEKTLDITSAEFSLLRHLLFDQFNSKNHLAAIRFIRDQHGMSYLQSIKIIEVIREITCHQ